MELLPKQLPVLDLDGRRTAKIWRNVGPRTEAARRFSEADWDRIICDHVEVLAEALRGAGVIAQDSMLRLLGTQVDNVDVLMAEVRNDQGGRQELRRLVLLEDKLLRNVEAKRTVLAQLLDYAQRAHDSWTVDALEGKLKNHAEWIKDNRQALVHTLRREDMLLVIAGDGLDEGLLRLARRFAAHDNPLSLTELALVSLGLFELEGQLLLIPHVVSSFQRSQREVTVNITVQDQRQQPIDAEITLAETVERPSTGHINRATFLESCAPVARTFFADLLDQVEKHGFSIYWGASGFSMRAQVGGESERWAFGYGFPRDEFRFYFQAGAPWSVAEDAAAFRTRLLATGLFRESGRLTLTSTINASTLERAREAATMIFEHVAHVTGMRG